MNFVSHPLQIIRSRLQPKGLYVWNHPPGGLYVHPEFSSSPTDYPFYRDYPRLGQLEGEAETHTPANYTAVITCTKPVFRESSLLVKLIKALSHAPHLQHIVIVWMGTGSPHIKLPNVTVPITVVTEDGSTRLTKQFWPTTDIQTDAILHLNEDVEMTSDEVRVCVCV